MTPKYNTATAGMQARSYLCSIMFHNHKNHTEIHKRGIARGVVASGVDIRG